MFKLVSKYMPSGDQPEAIKSLVEGIKEGKILKKEKEIKYYLELLVQVKRLLSQTL